MPKYKYKCIECEISFEVIHSMADTHTDCTICTASGSLERVPFVPHMSPRAQTGKPEVGSLVRQYIEDTKVDVKLEKTRYKKEEYDK